MSQMDDAAQFSDALVLEIKAEMGRKGLSSRALGRAIGKSSQYMSDRLDGGSPKTGERVTLTVRDLFAIAHALGMDEMQLVGCAAAVATDYALAASDDANWQEAQEQGEESE